MSLNQQRPEWKELKTKIHSKFGKLSEDDLNGLNGHMDKLTSTVQRAYNYDPKKAALECKVFNESLIKIK